MIVIGSLPEASPDISQKFFIPLGLKFFRHEATTTTLQRQPGFLNPQKTPRPATSSPTILIPVFARTDQAPRRRRIELP